MSYPNQDLTLHETHTFNKNCEYCADTYPATFDYEYQLRKSWLNLLISHPDIYKVDDYFQACAKVGIKIF